MVLSEVVTVSAKRRRQRSRGGLLLKQARLIVATLAAFMAGTHLLGQLIPSPLIPSNVVFVGQKYDFYKAHKDDYTALFFGSSRIHNQIVPEVFDQTAQSKDAEVNSYNFGIPAMRAIDSTVLLETVLKNPPENLKWVFFETILDKGYEPIENARTQRSMYWHTLENTAFAFRYIALSDQSLPAKLALWKSHLLPAIYHQLNVGRLFSQVLPSEFSERERAVAAHFTKTEGYFPLTNEDDPKRRDFLNNQESYRVQTEKLAKSMERSADDPRLATNKRMLLEKVVKAVRSVGAEPIFIEPPALHISQDFQAAQALGIVDTLLTYRNPNDFPNFYEPENRHDVDHLNDEASREFTQQLAEDFSAIALSQ